MQLGCDRCGFIVNPLYTTVPQSRQARCSNCGGTLRRMTLLEAVDLAREAEEARTWRAKGAGGAAR
jgi:hypothetical protein